MGEYMGDELTKKNVFVGDGGTKAQVFEEQRSTKSLEGNYAKVLVRQAGELHKPIGTKYLGSGVVHYYEKDGLTTNEKNYFVVCQTDVAAINEGHCDVGWKQLKAAFMQSYGREEPKTRSN